jgi:HK97 family phage major capsid protein
MAQKSVISDTGQGFATSGVITPQRLPGMFGLAMQELRIRDVMQVRQQNTGASFDWLKQNVRTNAPSPQVDGSAKSESTYGFTTATDKIRTIAHYTNVTNQALDDIPNLRSVIDSELTYGLKLKEEAEILSGPGTGEHLNGIITQATAYDTGTYNASGDTKLDKLRHMKLQARLAGLGNYPPSAFVVHPADMHTIELIKNQANNVGNYVVGDPMGPAMTFRTLWGLPVVESDSMTAATALCGAFSTAALLIDRMAMTIDISLEHSSNFTSNLATIRAEERIGLAVMVPGAFIYASSY